MPATGGFSIRTTSHADSFRACDCSIVLLTWRCCLCCCCCCCCFAVVLAPKCFPFDFVFWRRHAVFCFSGQAGERKQSKGAAIVEFFCVLHICVIFALVLFSHSVSDIARQSLFCFAIFTIFTVYATHGKGRGSGG